MTFFEKELHRLFDDSECISADAVFAGKTMIAPIGEDLRAKVQFVYTNTHAKYDALRLTIINRHEGRQSRPRSVLHRPRIGRRLSIYQVCTFTQ